MKIIGNTIKFVREIASHVVWLTGLSIVCFNYLLQNEYLWLSTASVSYIYGVLFVFIYWTMEK